MTDLKLIDELLCLMAHMDSGPYDWTELENRSHITRKAMNRLREARDSGEMKSITASLSIYFGET